MSIDLNKNEGQQQSSSRDYSNPNSSAEVREIYRIAYDCKNKNMPDYQVEQVLQNQGLSGPDVATVMMVVNRAMASRNAQMDSNQPGSSGGGMPSWLIYIGILVLVNILSAMFDWGFWIY